MTRFSAILFIHRKVTSSLSLADKLETLQLLDLVTDTKYFSFCTLHLKEFHTLPILDIAYNILLVIDVHIYRLQRNCSSNFGVIGYRLVIGIADYDMTSFVQHIYMIRQFGSNLYLKLNKNSCSNAQGILLVV
jgi:hypothetical protein